MIPTLGTIIAIGTATFLFVSYSRWCDRFFSSGKESRGAGEQGSKGASKSSSAHPHTCTPAQDAGADILSLSKAGTMQLRTIARVIHVKYYSRLKRDELILAIIAKKKELGNKQQQELFT